MRERKREAEAGRQAGRQAGKGRVRGFCSRSAVEPAPDSGPSQELHLMKGGRGEQEEEW